MSRPFGSTNKEKVQEVIFTHRCKDCEWVARTCIPNVMLGHNCTDYGKRVVKKTVKKGSK